MSLDEDDHSLPPPAEPLRLEYATRDAPVEEPSVLAAMAAGVPGGVCWMILLAAAGRHFAPRLVRLPPMPPAMLVAVAFLWVFVLVIGMVAVVAYLDRPKPWYVKISLMINFSGLGLTLVLFCLLLGGASE